MSVFIFTFSSARKEGRKVWGSLKRMTPSLKGTKRYAYLIIETCWKSNKTAMDNRWPDHLRSRSHDVISGTTSYRFLVKSSSWQLDVLTLSEIETLCVSKVEKRLYLTFDVTWPFRKSSESTACGWPQQHQIDILSCFLSSWYRVCVWIFIETFLQCLSTLLLPSV